MAKTPKRQLEYAKRYDEKLRRYVLRLHKEQDAELIDALDALPKGSVNSFLKKAIRTLYQSGA